jgi:4-amino-4-deoxy-L-arabinose transferase-like glycosyltransferase
VVQFDLLLVVCTLLAMIGLLSAADGSRRGWVEVALAVGLGGLVKGPVILIHVLPVALAAPLWAQSAGRWGWWYLGLLLAVSLGVGVTLAWALPAGWSGGEAYRNAIFWGQTAGRVRNSFAHAQPWWWYGLVLPLGLLPWSLWPRLWRSLAHRRLLSEPAVRFLLAWALPVVLVLTLVSGKQVKYLLPVFPALALLAARGLVNADRSEVLERPWLAGLCLLIPGLLVLILPLAVRLGLSEWLGKVSPGWGLALIGLGILIMVLPRQSLDRLVPGTAVAAMLALVVLHLGLSGPSARAYDLSEVACRIAGYQTAGRPVLNVGKYHGQYHFLGRLRQPLAEEMSQAALDWSADHPDGYVIVYEKQWAGVPEGAEYAQPYRGGSLSIWRAPAAFAHWGPTVEQGAP